MRCALRHIGRVGEEQFETVGRHATERLPQRWSPVPHVIDADQPQIAPVPRQPAMFVQEQRNVCQCQRGVQVCQTLPVVVIARHGVDAEWRVQSAQQTRHVGDRPVMGDNVAGEHDQVGALALHLLDAPCQVRFTVAKTEVAIGQMADAQPVEFRRQRRDAQGDTLQDRARWFTQ
jgi:hypothetical protein